MNFSDLLLDKSIQKAISACGYTKPTPVQAKSIPIILEKQDVVVSAQTGTGKTAAFVLPALHHLIEAGTKVKKARILILTPTRELATQITKAASIYGKFCHFNIVSLVGGMSYHHQIRDLQRGADIIVATPGRLLDHMEQKRVDLSNIDMLILDEADRMCDMGFIDDVQYIAKLTPGKRQTLLFSATVDKQLTTIVRHLLRDPVRIDLSEKKVTAANIEQIFYKTNNQHHKMRMLKEVLSGANIFKAIIFSATKINADNLADQLRADGFSAAALHGDLRQNVRTRTLDQLRRGKIQFLVATDVAARGIDINDITHVINYDLPKFCEDYVHRIGRTARAGKAGTAISFVSPADFKHVQRIERFIGQRLKLEAGPGVAASGKEESFSRSEMPRSEKPFRSGKPDAKFSPRSKKHPFSDKQNKFEKFGDKKSDSREGFSSRKSDSRERFGDKKSDAREGFSSRKSDSRERFGDKNSDTRSAFPQDSKRKKPADRRQAADSRPFKKKSFKNKRGFSTSTPRHTAA